MSWKKLGQPITFGFSTLKPSTGAKKNADCAPSITVYKGSVADALSVTVANPTEGGYIATCTPTGGAGFAKGDVVTFGVNALADGISGLDMFGSWELVTNDPDDIVTGVDALDVELDNIRLRTDGTYTAVSGLNIPTTAAIADGVWDEALADHLTGSSAGEALNTAASGLNVRIEAAYDEIADAVWDEAIADHQAGGSAGESLNTAASGLMIDAGPINEFVSALFNKAGITAGGTATFQDITKAVYAMARGKIDSTSNVHIVRDDDDATALFTLTIADDGRTTT